MADRPWWQTTTIYQVYPRSFADSDGDGIGDLRGIIDHLDHLVDLGIGTVWVSPFFASPQEDFGYDVTDYCAVAPEYGTLADADELVEEAHRRGLKVLFDLVLNHTSDQHPWFVESRTSRDNPRADWYIWADGRGRWPPNNWRSAVELKRAWQWCEQRGQWYLATFLPFQPDLNWRNPDVEAAMFDIVRFWLRRGVDGFRLDMFGAIMKDPGLRNNALRPSTEIKPGRIWRRVYTENTADNMVLARKLRAVCDEFPEPERVLLGEVFGSPDVLRGFLGEGEEPGLQMVFLFDFLTFRYTADWFRRTIGNFETAFADPLQPTLVLENHDRSRSIDRVGGNLDRARVLATILLTARGVPTVYMGQEIGMANTYIPLRQSQDPIAHYFFGWVPEFMSKRLPERINRDEVRTPMQWDGSPNAGFCPSETEPWLPVNANHTTVNVATEAADPSSLLSLYRELLALRRARTSLSGGSIRLLDAVPAEVLAYERHDPDGDDRTLVVANLGSAPVTVTVPEACRLLLATREDVSLEVTALQLPPDRAAVLASDQQKGIT